MAAISMQRHDYHKQHTGTWTHTCVNVNAGLLVEPVSDCLQFVCVLLVASEGTSNKKLHGITACGVP